MVKIREKPVKVWDRDNLWWHFPAPVRRGTIPASGPDHPGSRIFIINTLFILCELSFPGNHNSKGYI